MLLLLVFSSMVLTMRAVVVSIISGTVAVRRVSLVNVVVVVDVNVIVVGRGAVSVVMRVVVVVVSSI